MKYLRRELNQVEKEYVKQFGEDSLNRVILHDPDTKDKQEVQDTSKLSSDKVLSNDENKALQKKYLGYYSYKEVKRPFNAEYTFYIFKFDYSYNMFTVAGMAVNPEQTRVIYFLNTVE